MAIVNVDQLMYPGVGTCRVACPISTYHEQEILKFTGVTDSLYISKPLVTAEESPKEKKGDKKKDKPAKKGGKDSKASKSSKSSKKSDKSKKGGKGKKELPSNDKTGPVDLTEVLFKKKNHF